jgi:hypothetical protein
MGVMDVMDVMAKFCQWSSLRSLGDGWWVVGSRTPLAHPLASVVGLQFVVCCLYPTTRSLLSGTGSLGVVCLSYLTQPTNN